MGADVKHLASGFALLACVLLTIFPLGAAERWEGEYVSPDLISTQNLSRQNACELEAETRIYITAIVLEAFTDASFPERRT